MIPKSKNNGNDCDYIYLDMLNGDDVGEFLLFENKLVSNNSRKNIPPLLETNHTKGTYPYINMIFLL